MQRLEFTHSSELRLQQAVRNHSYTLRILPGDDPAQQVRITSCVVRPAQEHSLQEDGFGNRLFIGSCTRPHDRFGYEVSGTAVVDAAKGRGSACSVLFTCSSPLCVPGPALHALAAEGAAPAAASGPQAVFSRAQQLCAFVYDAMEYVPGSTSVATTAEQAAAQRTGVCQDYAHVLAVLLRMEGIPARYICGLMIGEGATHAWVEFFDGQTWWGLDPTNNCEAGDFYIVLARGRDHSDCPMERGVFRGGAMQRLKTQVQVSVVD